MNFQGVPHSKSFSPFSITGEHASTNYNSDISHHHSNVNGNSKSQENNISPMNENKKAELKKGWEIVYRNDDIVKEWDVQIRCKTRLDPFSETIPDALYAPIIYQLHQKVLGKNALEMKKTFKFLMTKITVVNYENPEEEIKKNDKVIMSGKLEFALTSSLDDESFHGFTKLQFTDSSYHHRKKSFCWEIRFYAPDDLQNPILIKRSTPFKVFARKPYTNRSTKRKRQIMANANKEQVQQLMNGTASSFSQWYPGFDRKGQSDGPTGLTNNNSMVFTTMMTHGTIERPSKMLKVDSINNVQDISTFAQKLNELISYNSKLEGNEKKLALSMAFQQLINLDPQFSAVIMLNNLQELIANGKAFTMNNANVGNLPNLGGMPILRNYGQNTISSPCK